MASTYVHMSGRDIDNAILQVHGKQSKEAIAPQLTEKVCPRCRYGNGIDFLHCKQCGAPLDPETLMKSDEAANEMRDFAIELAKHPEFKDDIHQYFEDKRKKRK